MKLWIVLHLAANEPLPEPFVTEDEDVAINEAERVATAIAHEAGAEAIDYWDDVYSPEEGRYARVNRQIETTETELRYAELTTRR